MARKLCRFLAVLSALAVGFGCSKDNKFDGPIASTQITTQSKPAGQPKIKTEPKVDPPIVKVKPPVTTGLSKDEEQLLGMMDQARDQAKLPRLKTNPVLMQLAKEHAAKMLQDKGAAPPAVPQPAGYLAFGSGAGSGGGKVDLAAVMGNANQLVSNAAFQEVGVAIAQDASGGRFVHVEVFGQPMK